MKTYRQYMNGYLLGTVTENYLKYRFGQILTDDEIEKMKHGHPVKDEDGDTFYLEEIGED